jgi:peptide/nickel transport system substrate-binding protein
MQNRNYLLAIIFVSIIFIFQSCGNKKEYEGKKILYYNESKGIASLDPAYARNQSVIWAVNQIYNGLLQTDDSLNILPCIASSYSISDDGKEYTFHLRRDVFFHDSKVFPTGRGRKVTAFDFEYSFQRILDPKVASPGSWIFDKVNKAKGNNGFEAVNDSVLKIYLSVPFPAFTGILTMPYCFVVPREAVVYYGKEYRSHPVGTGPFYLKHWEEGEKLVLLKNEHYFEHDSSGRRYPFLDAVVIYFIVDKQSEFLEFMSGKLDFISGINPFYKDELITSTGELRPEYANRFNCLKSAYLNIEYLGILVDSSLNTVKNSALNNIWVRKAMNMSIDRKKMMTYMRNNIGYPAFAGFVPKGIPSFSDTFPKGYPYSPDSAKKLLIKAGFPNGKGIKPMTLTTTADYADLCEFIQYELQEVNIPLEIEVVNGLSYREMLANAKLNLFRASWIADYPDAESFLNLFYSPNRCPAGPNYTRFANVEYDRKYLQALKEKDINKRYQLYREMDQIVINNAPVIPLYYDVAIRFTRKNIHNMHLNPLNLLVLKNVDKDNSK